MGPVRPSLVALLLLVATGCGGGDPLPADQSGAVMEPGPAERPAPEPTATAEPEPEPTPEPTPEPEPEPTMEPEPTPTPVLAEEPPPGSDAAGASIEVVGLGNPPPEPPIHGRDLWVEAIVFDVTPRLVEFYIDDRRVRTDRRWPYTLGAPRFDTRTVSDGFHVVSVRAVFPDETALVVHEPMWVENP